MEKTKVHAADLYTRHLKQSRKLKKIVTNPFEERLCDLFESVNDVEDLLDFSEGYDAFYGILEEMIITQEIPSGLRKYVYEDEKAFEKIVRSKLEESATKERVIVLDTFGNKVRSKPPKILDYLADTHPHEKKLFIYFLHVVFNVIPRVSDDLTKNAESNMLFTRSNSPRRWVEFYDRAYDIAFENIRYGTTESDTELSELYVEFSKMFCPLLSEVKISDLQFNELFTDKVPVEISSGLFIRDYPPYYIEYTGSLAKEIHEKIENGVWRL